MRLSARVPFAPCGGPWPPPESAALSASVSTTNDRLALSRFVFEMGDTVHLDRLLNAVRRIEAVYDVYRVSAG